MICKKILLIFFLSAIMTVFSKQSLGYQFDKRPTDSSSEKRASDSRYFFWEVPSGANTVYILGSIHLVREDLYPLSRKIEEAFERSDALAVEVDLTKVDELEVAANMISKAFYYDGSTLADNLSPEIYQLAKESLEDLGLDIKMFNIYQPWFLALQLTTHALVELGFDPEQGVDQYFLKKAIETGKKIVGMETLTYQLSLFDSLSEDLQGLFLLLSLTEIETLESHADRLFQIWKKGDRRRLKILLRRGLEEYPELEPFYDKVFYQRNKRMVEQIEGYLTGDELYFVVVGAGHLVGREGIIQILQDKGYNPRQY